MIERITYDNILETMENEFETLSGIPADDASDVSLRMKVLAGQVFSLSSKANWIFEQIFPQTATGERLDRLAQMRGINRSGATYAYGTVRFYRDESNTQATTIPSGTLCATDSPDGKQYQTTVTTVMNASSEYADAEVVAIGAGSSYNAAPGSVNVLINPPSGIDSVTNLSAISHGREEESDEALRKRLLDSYLNRSNGLNAAYYKELACSVDGVISANVIPVARGAGTLDIALDVSGSTLVEKQAIVSAVDTLVQANRNLGIDIDVAEATEKTQNFTINVKPKNGVSMASATSEIQSVVTNYFNSLGVGENLILADIGSKIFSLGILENYNIVVPSADTSIGADEIMRVGTITVNEL